METIYKDTLLFTDTDDYRKLVNLPTIESTTVLDTEYSDHYNIYDKEQILTLIKQLRSVKIVPTKPTDPSKNTLYYVGTYSPYDMYFYTAVKKEVYLGASSLPNYKGEDAIEVTTTLNVRLRIDPKTLEINELGQLQTIGTVKDGLCTRIDDDNYINLLVASRDDVPTTALNNEEEALTLDTFTKTLPGAVMKPEAGEVKYLKSDVSWSEFQKSKLIGEIKLFGGTPDATKWHLCDGAAVSRTAYPELFAKIGTIYGAGDGSTTFNLPNLIGRMPEGFGDVTRTMKNATGSGTYTWTTNGWQVGKVLENGVPNVTGRQVIMGTAWWNSSDMQTGATWANTSWTSANKVKWPWLLLDTASVGDKGKGTFVINLNKGPWNVNATKLMLDSIEMPYYIRMK